MIKKNTAAGNKMDALLRTRIARQIYKAAESMGIADREETDAITRQVLDRIEAQTTTHQAMPLPGWETFVAGSRSKDRSFLDDLAIQTILREIVTTRRNSPRTPAGEAPSGIGDTIEKLPIQSEAAKPEERYMINTGIPTKNLDSIKQGIELTENARRVLEKRYLKRDKNDRATETAGEMLLRVAQAVAQAELIYHPNTEVKPVADDFYRVMKNLEFLPNSPTLMNAGRELGQLSACFVLPIEDSMESIFDAVKYTALIHKSGGGTGFSFARLRPENDRVGSTGGVASGPVSFMRAFDAATEVIKQGGMRRGANMGILSVDHPDIERFIHAKEDMKSLTNFNISVAITGAFMEAVKNKSNYNLINPHSGAVAGTFNAGKVFDEIVTEAWRTGDPGLIFIDKINEYNPTPNLGKIESTNPCGEQPLLPNESCNLGSINLSRMLTENGAGRKALDYEHLASVVRTAVHFLDNVIDVNNFPLPQIEEATRKTRKIGLGVMGYADMLLEMGIPYGSEEAVGLAEEIMKFITGEARKTSAGLAEQRGVFPAFRGSTFDLQGIKVRNAAVTTIAPTGTISIIAGVSSGIEPLFALSYVRNILDGAQLYEVNPIFERVAHERGFYSADLMRKLATGTSLKDISEAPEDVKKVFVTAHDIEAVWHIKTQAAFQKHVDNAVSKTINFPHNATVDDVRKAYLMAYDYGLKGITIYRDGSRDAQVLSTQKKELKEEAKSDATGITPRKRSKITFGQTEMVNTGCGHLYITVNSDEKGVFEVFSHLGKAGGCATAQLEAICRLVSLALRAGVDTQSIVEQLRGIRCPSIAWEEGKAVLSCADAIGAVLGKQATGINGKAKAEDYGTKNLAGQCPDCSCMLVYEEGCFKCPNCGFTKC
jgi:ribonucleoside-diphosphate reductase alpha chain